MQTEFVFFFALYVLSGHVLLPLFIRFRGLKGNSEENLFVQFSVAFLLSLLSYVFFHNTPFRLLCWPIALVGMLNAMSCRYQWIAMKESLSGFSALQQLVILPVLLASFALFQEDPFSSSQRILGLCSCLVGLMAFVWPKQESDRFSQRTALFFQSITFSILISAAIAIFSKLYISFEDVSIWEMSLWYYGGSACSAFLLFLFLSPKEKASQAIVPSPRRFFHASSVCFAILPLGILVFLLRISYFGLLRDAPLYWIQSALQVSAAIVPFLLGHYVFHEREARTKRERLGFFLMTAGCLLLTAEVVR